MRGEVASTIENRLTVQDKRSLSLRRRKMLTQDGLHQQHRYRRRAIKTGFPECLICRHSVLFALRLYEL